VVARHARKWFDDAFMIARFHPNRSWTCLSTSISDLGSGRWTFWDVVDGANKYGIDRLGTCLLIKASPRLPTRNCSVNWCSTWHLWLETWSGRV
jgi:hypothetical protein